VRIIRLLAGETAGTVLDETDEDVEIEILEGLEAVRDRRHRRRDVAGTRRRTSSACCPRARSIRSSPRSRTGSTPRRSGSS
jgi:hypothetical protein